MTDQLLQLLVDHGSSGGIVIVALFLWNGYRRLFSDAEESHDKRLCRLETEFAAYRERTDAERSRLEGLIDRLRGRLEEQSKQLAESRERALELRLQNTRMAEEISHLEAENGVLRQQIAALNRRLTDIDHQEETLPPSASGDGADTAPQKPNRSDSSGQ